MKRAPERIFIRKYCKESVIYTDVKSGRRFNAVMHNCSMDGMYLELGEYIPPGREIEVRVRKQLAGSYRRESYENFRLKVIWCKERKNLGRISYGVGVRRVMPEATHSNMIKPEVRSWHQSLL
ncbi:MAG: PilZ domain-containing protein [Proteobacteria bacterium]|nr:PilZ domain-containing protein [Pseudomonadota bacterium]